MDHYTMGIDIGTTSVKVCVLNLKNNEVVAENSKDTQAGVPSDQGIGGNKQDAPKIISALNNCIAKLPKDLLQQVARIGICGQMHGVVFWHHRSSSKAWERIEKDGTLIRYDVKPTHVSNLYTWQDNRCDQSFLASLPVPDSHLQIHSGYGMATMFWMMKNRQSKLDKYDCVGTIQDFAVAMLCNSTQHFTSDQNAASWGYYNCVTGEWNIDILEEANFPCRILPLIKTSGQIAGLLADTWHHIPEGTPIGVAMGDLQCSVLSTLECKTDGVLNISTSAQLAYIAGTYVPKAGPPDMDPVLHIPYFNAQYLAVAASLNGGNSLASFVRTLQNWSLELGFSVPQAKVWSKLIELSLEEKAESDLNIVPTCLGERHDPNVSGSITNINVGNLGLGQVFRALCEGMVRNLHSLMPKDGLEKSEIERIIGNGSGLLRNKTLQKSIKDVYGIPFVLGREFDTAAKGAAMSMFLP